MDTGFRSVISSGGSMHFEQQVGNMRFDLSDGSMTQILGSFGDTQSVARPDGSIGIEQTVGNMRFNVDQGNFDQLL